MLTKMATTMITTMLNTITAPIAQSSRIATDATVPSPIPGPVASATSQIVTTRALAIWIAASHSLKLITASDLYRAAGVRIFRLDVKFLRHSVGITGQILARSTAKYVG